MPRQTSFGTRADVEVFLLTFPLIGLSHSSGDDNLFLDDPDHFLQNPTASVASLRRLITSIPER